MGTPHRSTVLEQYSQMVKQWATGQKVQGSILALTTKDAQEAIPLEISL
jgi:hypothetical protein